MRPRRATYRLQLRQEFSFAEAAGIADYLGRLGISDLYASPILQARAGSAHGYDIVDHQRLSADLGGSEGFVRLCGALESENLGLVLDIVPNHMGVAGADNTIWLNVLEWGPNAAHASWFDIDWAPQSRRLRGKILVPVLGDQYGVALEQGKLRLAFDAGAGEFAVWAYETHKLPICPLHYEKVLGNGSEPLQRLGDLFSNIAPPREVRAALLKARLAELAKDTAVRQEVERHVAAMNARPATLASLIALQFWRAAHFRVAADDINYRRFFNVNELAGIRMETDEVFEETHRVIFSLVERGCVTGLRVDHIDGLLDPKAYLIRLRSRLPEDGLLLVEKILAPHESLREDWPIDGTTGYEFAGLALGVLIDPAGAEALNRSYVDFTGDRVPFGEVARESKHRIMKNELASELQMLAREVASIAVRNPKTADFTRNILQRALKEVLACFPVYRTYLDEAGAAAEADRRDIAWAVTVARKKETSLDPTVFDFLQQLLLGELKGVSRYAALRCAMKVQQYSGPVMAKSLEDTAFYRHTAFLALNEVGSTPEQFGATVSAFHKANMQRAARWPRTLLATSTHDTKRGEDARARLAVLAEMGEEWNRQVQVWSRVLRARRGDIEGQGPPDRRDEFALYQLLAATWPVDLLETWDPPALAAYAARVSGAMLKSVREAKLHTTWAQPNLAYEEAVAAFVHNALDPAQGPGFREAFLPFVNVVAHLGAHNSLVQTVLKLTVPGIPDIYQGCELWDLAMVDPDNRQPVDFAHRRRALEEIMRDRRTVRDEMQGWRSGRFKLAAIHALLDLRRRVPGLFDRGSYQLLSASGPDADRIIAFARLHEEDALVVLAGRFPARGAFEKISVDLEVPELLKQRVWRDVLSNESVTLPCGLGLLGIRVLCTPS